MTERPKLRTGPPDPAEPGIGRRAAALRHLLLNRAHERRTREHRAARWRGFRCAGNAVERARLRTRGIRTVAQR
jgi:hypothetical protein